jgi:hypothetical protein
MGRLQLPMSGQCRCGAVKIVVRAPPIMTFACHCRGCQRMSSSAFSLSAGFPTDAFEVSGTEPVIGGMRDPKLRHYFCPQCMSWLYTRPALDWVNVRPTMLEDPSWFRPYMETCTRWRLPWAHVPAVLSYPEFPPMENFPALLAEFARIRDGWPEHPAPAAAPG